MKASDIFSYAFDAIKLRKLRTGLTTLGVIIGIAAIVALLSISQGLQATITEQLQKGFATDTLIVSVGRGFGLGSNGMGTSDSGFNLLVNDTQIIDGLNHVEMSVAVLSKVGYVKSDERELVANIIGVDFIRYANIYSGTFIAETGGIPQNLDSKMVVVGKRVNDPWKNNTLFCELSDTVEIIWTNATARPPENETYTGHVAAILQEIGGFSLIGPSDSAVYIPLSQAQRFFGTYECDTIIVQLDNDNEATIASVSAAIRGVFSDQVSVTSSTAVLHTLSSVFSILELFLGGIAAISLLVAGIGIMNIMIVSLMERTREIGILKALGMKGRTVLLIFLSEAAIVGLIGTVFGITSGWFLANVVARVFGGGGLIPQGNQATTVGRIFITPVLTPTVLLGAFVFGVLVSIIFALYPARRASKLKPVDALRYE